MQDAYDHNLDATEPGTREYLAAEDIASNVEVILMLVMTRTPAAVIIKRVARRNKCSVIKASAIYFRTQALARILFERPQLVAQEASDAQADKLFSMAAVQPLVQKDDEFVFEMEDFIARTTLQDIPNRPQAAPACEHPAELNTNSDGAAPLQHRNRGPRPVLRH